MRFLFQDPHDFLLTTLTPETSIETSIWSFVPKTPGTLFYPRRMITFPVRRLEKSNILGSYMYQCIMTTISQRNTGLELGQTCAIYRTVDIRAPSLCCDERYNGEVYKNEGIYPPASPRSRRFVVQRLLSEEQKTGPGKMPERSTSTTHTSETTGWGKKHLAICGVSH